MAAARLPSLDRPRPLDGVVGGLVWDNHACMPLRRGETEFLRELADVHAAGVDIVTLNVGFGEQRAIDHFHMLATFRRWIACHNDKSCLVGTDADVHNARAPNRLGICFDIEALKALAVTATTLSLSPK